MGAEKRPMGIEKGSRVIGRYSSDSQAMAMVPLYVRKFPEIVGTGTRTVKGDLPVELFANFDFSRLQD